MIIIMELVLEMFHFNFFFLTRRANFSRWYIRSAIQFHVFIPMFNSDTSLIQIWFFFENFRELLLLFLKRTTLNSRLFHHLPFALNLRVPIKMNKFIYFFSMEKSFFFCDDDKMNVSVLRYLKNNIVHALID